jgi:Domain of unknown function (DUF397)
VTVGDELTTATWWNASSGGTGCVDTAVLSTGGAVRDSQNPEGGALCVGPEGMEALILSAKSGALRAPR